MEEKRTDWLICNLCKAEVNPIKHTEYLGKIYHHDCYDNMMRETDKLKAQKEK
jgi:hypothetical protein